MMGLFGVSELEEHELVPAFALVRTLAPDVSLERWLGYAHEIKRRGGILALRGAQEALFGLLTWREEDCLRIGRVLLIENFIVFELSGASPGRKALCQAAEALAFERGYSAVRLVIGGKGYVEADLAKSRGWTALGHDLDQIIFTKQLDRVE